MPSEPEVEPTFAPLQFDRAEPADPAGAPALACERCHKQITGTYYHDGKKTLCAGCGKIRQRLTAPDTSAATFLRAVAFGLGAALAGSALYFAVMEYLGRFSIVAIAIGWMVGEAVVKATKGRSARRHQVLAVVLTYLSVAAAYTPYAIQDSKLTPMLSAVEVLAIPIGMAIASFPVGILSLVLLGYGLRRAWRISGASTVSVTGPHTLAGGTI